MTATEQAGGFLELPPHRLLLVMRGVEARERWNRYLCMTGLVVRGVRERGIHDDKIAGLVLDRDGMLATAVRFHAPHGLAHGEQGVGMIGIEKVECADVYLVAVDAVGHCVDL